MLQWRRVFILAIVILLSTALAQADTESIQIDLGLDASVQTTGVKLAENNSQGMTLHFQTPALEVKDEKHAGQDYQLLNLPGAELDGAIGEPALPLFSRLVLVPDGYTLEVADIRSNDFALEGTFKPYPAQDIRQKGDEDLSLDTDYYMGRSPKAAPALVSVGSPGLARGLRVVPVLFRPVQWNPADGHATVASEMDVTLRFVPAQDGMKSSIDSRQMPESFANMYEQEVIGFNRDEANVHEGLGTYLIIHPENASVATAIEPLVEWRARQGYNVLVAHTGQTGTYNTSIKNYIQNIYNTVEPPLEFVTLVGDANGSIAIPPFHENLSGYNGEGDHAYTQLEGGDILADVHIGRITCDSVSRLQGLVTKIVDYEKDPYVSDDVNWFTRASLTGDPGASGYSCIWVNQWVKQQLLENSYTQVDTIWSGNYASLMSADINAGVSFFTYRGYYGMSGMHTGYIDALNNGMKLPFALILTCDTGSFTGYARSEAFFRNTNGGAIGAIGTATSGTHTRYNNCMFQGVAEGLINSGDPRQGPGLTRGKLHLYRNYNDRESSRVEIWSTWNNLMGDPATALYSAIPRELNADYATSLSAAANNLHVFVHDGTLGVEGALVTVYRKDEMQVSVYTDAAGNANVPLNDLNDGEYMVTVTAHNKKPHLGGFNVGPVAASIDYASVMVDDSLGNDDGLINPGETVELWVDLGNSGTSGVSNVSAQLASHELDVEVQQGDAEFGYISSGATATGQESFLVHFDPTVKGGSTVRLPLSATDGSDTWVSLMDLTITGPTVNIRNFNFSSNLDPGETVNLNVELVNVGNLATSGATATLTSDSRWVSVVDEQSLFGAMNEGGSANNSGDVFSISAGAECYPGHTANLEIEVAFNEGGTVVLPLVVTVGNVQDTDPVGPDAYGYYAFDNTDSGYEFMPSYDWVEIAPSGGGQGVSVGLTDQDRWQDDVVVMDLPFPFMYYGQTFDKLSVCSNGWISFGATDLRHYRNWTIPSPGAPDNMIAVYWDDLHIGSGDSGIYQWYDATNHRLIIEWDHCQNAVSGVRETFQVILHDPAYGAGDTGDGIITMNYQDVNHTDQETGYGTVGIQNEDRDVGLLYTYYQLYPAGAADLVDGRSITFRTVIPQTQGTLRGLVTNAGNGEAIDGANVSILGTGLNIMTTDEGVYQSNLSLGTYSIAVSHPSFAPDTTHNVVINEEMVTELNFSLEDIAGPAFTMLTQPESNGDLVGPYEVVFRVKDYTGIEETHFYYTSSTAGGPFELALIPTGEEDTFRAEIPGQASGTLVQYWLTSTDVTERTTVMPEGAPFDVYSFMVAETEVLYSTNMEGVEGWSGGISGDGATSGIWEMADPNAVTDDNMVIVPENDHTVAGVNCWVTGQDPVGSQQGANDIDGGATTLQSPSFDISSATGVEVQYFRWYTNDTGNSPGEDNWVVQARDQGGNWVNLENTTTSNRAWQQMSFVLADHLDLGNTLQFRFVASDHGGGSVVEALVDDFSLTSFPSVVDMAAPQVALTSPVGGESFAANSEQTITWNGSDDTGIVHVDIMLSTDGGSNWDHLIATGALAGSCEWTVPTLPGDQNRIRIVAYDSHGNQTAADSADFTIVGSTSAVGDVPINRLTLAQNAPNPFNPATEIQFALPSDQNVTLRVYNIDGRLVRTLVQGQKVAGEHSVMWMGKNDHGGQVASGLYFYRLITDSGTLTRKMTLLK